MCRENKLFEIFRVNISIYLWVVMGIFCFLPNSSYQTFVDVVLRDWSQHELPQTCVQVGWEVLYDELERSAREAEHSRGYDHIFDKLKKEVITQTRNRHQWDPKAITRLVSLVDFSNLLIVKGMGDPVGMRESLFS